MTMTSSTVTLTFVVAMTLAGHVSGFPFMHHRPMLLSDGSPLDAMVTDMFGRVVHLTDQLRAQGAQITDLGTQLTSVTMSVAFTVTFSGRDLEGLDTQQPLLFDKVLLNAGDGYDARSGFFTAPAAGLYAFDIHVTRHPLDTDQCVEVGLYRTGGHLLPVVSVSTATACRHTRDQGHSRTVVSLARGDTVHAQLLSGSSLMGDTHTAWSGLKV